MASFKEVETAVGKFYAGQNGLLIAISDFGEAVKTSSLVEGYCGKSCQRCLAGVSVVSLGEVRQELSGSGLFAVGLLDVKHQKECPIFKDLSSAESTPK